MPSNITVRFSGQLQLDPLSSPQFVLSNDIVILKRFNTLSLVRMIFTD